MKAQFLKEIDDVLSPPQIDFNHYDISFKIPRVVSEPTRLFSDCDYQFMVRESAKGKTVLNVRVEITQKKFAAKVSTIDVYMHAHTHLLLKSCGCSCRVWERRMLQ